MHGFLDVQGLRWLLLTVSGGAARLGMFSNTLLPCVGPTDTEATGAPRFEPTERGGGERDPY